MFGKRKIATLVAEFLGTGILTLLVLSVQRSTIGVPFFVALAAGLTMVVLYFALGGVSGGYFNPAITIALWTARKVKTVNAILFIAVQFLGAWLAYYLYTYLVNSTLQNIGGHFTGRILVAEAVGTGIFAFGWAASVYQGYTKSLSAAVVGISYMVGIVAASAASIGLANPALALGVRAWVWGTYVLGPVLGAVVGVNLYGLLFSMPDAAVVTSGAAVKTTKSSEVYTEIEAPVKKPRATRTTKAKTTAKRPAARRTSAASRSTTTRSRRTTR